MEKRYFTRVSCEIRDYCSDLFHVTNDDSGTMRHVEFECKTTTGSFVSVEHSRVFDGVLEIERFVEGDFIATF